jgi:hypothetical protein
MGRVMDCAKPMLIGIGAGGVSSSYEAAYSGCSASAPPHTVIYRQYTSPGISPCSACLFRSRRCSQARNPAPLIFVLFLCTCQCRLYCIMGTRPRGRVDASAYTSSSTRVLNFDASARLLHIAYLRLKVRLCKGSIALGQARPFKLTEVLCIWVCNSLGKRYSRALLLWNLILL